MYGKRIQEIRLGKGLKSGYVANQLGFKKEEYSQLEHGKRLLRPELLLKVCKVLDITPNDILCPELHETQQEKNGKGVASGN